MDGKVQELESELEKDPEKINQKGDLDYTPLAIAVARELSGVGFRFSTCEVINPN